MYLHRVTVNVRNLSFSTASVHLRADADFRQELPQRSTDQTTLTRNLRPLVRRGLVSVEPGEDRRTREIRLTADGHRVYQKALPLWRKVQARVTGKLGKSHWKAMQRELDQLIVEVAG